jgi:hypothetical protein
MFVFGRKRSLVAFLRNEFFMLVLMHSRYAAQ